ncbi:MAG: hypothetical protein NXI30_04590 [bacterium]|nr:hypothetical protein [bacterium]
MDEKTRDELIVATAEAVRILLFASTAHRDDFLTADARLTRAIEAAREADDG